LFGGLQLSVGDFVVDSSQSFDHARAQVMDGCPMNQILIPARAWRLAESTIADILCAAVTVPPEMRDVPLIPG
jgi:hypothetical protein